MYRLRRRRALVVAASIAALAYAVSQAGSNRNGGHTQTPRRPQRATASTQHQAGASAAVRWPAQGQAAFVLGSDRPAASPGQEPAPIASLAKVMTAYLTLRRYPLTGSRSGFTVTVTASDVQAERDDVSEGQSGVAVQVGEQLTERQLLEALLIPSGNNIAAILAERVAGSEAGFVAAMNSQARVLGMRHTIYTDPSGFASTTVSTAADQLKVFRAAMGSAVFRQIVSMYSVTLPVAGTLRNFNPLIARGYAGKTGSDSAAGGCLAFFTTAAVGGHRKTAVGVAMGQGEGNSTAEILWAAAQAAEQLVASATQNATARPPDGPPFGGGRRSARGRDGRRPRPPTQSPRSS